jgi:plasmid stability protein
MPTLYVENVPEELYEALRERAREHRSSISIEVLSLLKQNVPTPSELARRKDFLARASRIRNRRPRASGPFPTSEEMQREDRRR